MQSPQNETIWELFINILGALPSLLLLLTDAESPSK